MSAKTEGVQKLWNRYKYAVLIGALGVGMLLWSGSNPKATEAEPFLREQPVADAELLQTELEEILKTITGVGEVKILLTLDSDGERQLAQDAKLAYRGDPVAPEEYSRSAETVLVDGGSGDQTVVTKTCYPVYRGALVVCQGGDRADVQLAVTQAVSVLTGLSSDRIAVAKWQ